MNIEQMLDSQQIVRASYLTLLLLLVCETFFLSTNILTRMHSPILDRLRQFIKVLYYSVASESS